MHLRMALAFGVLLVGGIGAIAQEDIVKLPEPDKAGTMTVEAAIAQRRSIRSYQSDPLSLAEIG